MPDRTYYQVTLYGDVGTEKLDNLAEECFEELGGDPDTETVTLAPSGIPAHVFSFHEAPVGESGTVATALLNYLGSEGEVSFDVREDPAYEWLGELVRYRHGLGRHSVECDSEGNPLLKAETYQKYVEESRRTGTDLTQLLNEHFGVDWDWEF